MSNNGQTMKLNGIAGNTGLPALCSEDADQLKQLEHKLQLVRDRVVAVCRSYATGLYLHGDGGVGKSYTVLQALRQAKADFVVFNSRMTGRGLYNVLEGRPSTVHVLEDMEQLARDKGAQGVLRSALWAQRKPGAKGPLERLVTWTTYRMEHSFIFTGGIIMLANRPLADVPELQAVKTRIPNLHLEASAAELRALMRSVALQGYEHDGKRLEPAECWEVCEYLIQDALASRRALDMRLLINGFADYLQWQEGDAGCHWHDLLIARLRERSTTFEHAVALGSRAAEKKREQAIAREIAQATTNREQRRRRWFERTGKSEPTLYRRLAEVKAPRTARAKT